MCFRRMIQATVVSLVCLTLVATTVTPADAQFGAPVNAVLLQQNSPEAFDAFGSAMVWGDFNGDGQDDLAVSAPYEDVGTSSDAGMVTVFTGTPSGLTNPQNFHQDTPGVPGKSEDIDFFGFSLAAGDFNGDGFEDLAVGSPGEDIGSTWASGMVTVLNGSPTGLTATGAQNYHQGTPGVPGINEFGDRFGWRVAAGDFNGDSIDDLAIGVPRESMGSGPGSAVDAGMVIVLNGTSTGLTGIGAQACHQGTPGIPGSNETMDNFGWRLATGDFNGDNIDDLAIGAPGEDVGSAYDAGMVTILGGTTAGLDSTNAQIFHQATPGVPGALEDDDRFGDELAAGDFNGDGYDDLATSSPYEAIGSARLAGMVTILNGTPTGLTGTGAQNYHQGTPGIPGSNEHDRFGYALAVGDFDGDTIDDLAVGAPYEADGPTILVGRVTILNGTPTGLTGRGAQMYDQDTAGIPDSNEQSDYFGKALAASEAGSLAIAAPNEALSTYADDGAVTILDW